LANHFGQLVFVFAKVGHEINVDATVAENLNSGFAEFVGYEYFGSHDERPLCRGPDWPEWERWKLPGMAGQEFT
jgi:hypothetical protein